MPRHQRRHRHLGRLDQVWLPAPIAFVTACVAGRRAILANDTAHGICREVWLNAERLYGWRVGRYVVMPDHVHFFCTPVSDIAKLDTFVGKWKEWTAKYAQQRSVAEMPLWQERFFDHLLRSTESYEQKSEYMRQNPVRAGLVMGASDWPYQGEIHPLRGD